MEGYYIMLKRTISLATFASVLAMTSSAYADAASKGASLPTLNISGNTVMNAYYVDQSHNNAGKSGSVHFANDVSDLYFIIKGRMGNGIEYGYKMGIQAFSNGSPVFQQNYVEFNGKFGTVQFGNVVGPEDTMIQDAGTIVGGTGTFDGGYHNVVNLAAFALRGNDNIGDTGYATKIAYYTPSMYNFRFGIAYTPSTAHRGDEGLDRSTLVGNTNASGNRTFLPNKALYPYGLDSVAVGLTFQKEWNNWGFNLNGAYITDQSYYPVLGNIAGNGVGSRVKARRTNAYQLGTVIGYRRQNGNLVQVAGGYLNNGKSRLFKKAGAENAMGDTAPNFADLYKGNSGRAWNVGAAYVMGIYKFAASYQQTERRTDATQKARNHVSSITADVVPVGGLKFYVEADYIRSRSNEAARGTATTIKAQGKNEATIRANQITGNDATVVILGTKVSF